MPGLWYAAQAILFYVVWDVLVVAQVTAEKPFNGPESGDLAAEHVQRFELHDVEHAERQLLSTQDFHDALMRLRQLDVPVQAFLNSLDRLGPDLPARLPEIIIGGLEFSIGQELARRDEAIPHRIYPLSFADLTLSSDDVLHAMRNHWQWLMIVNPDSMPSPEVGDWATHMAQFVFVAVDEAYAEQGGPPLLADD